MKPEQAKIERSIEPSPLKLFFENQVLPYLPELERELYKTLEGDDYSMDTLNEYYNTLCEYDPVEDKGKNFSNAVLLPMQALATSTRGSKFENVREIFLEKTKLFGEILYRDAFFRNRYDSLEAWKSCRNFKEFKVLLKKLELLPSGAEQRIAIMSRELDILWTQPETERIINKEMADEYVQSGVGREGGMLERVYREESAILSEDKYDTYHGLRPDLFPEKYEDYLKEQEQLKYPYRLEL